ncbi:MAG: hypothetical protein IKN32_08695 [Bacteroidales bacterium]|nr:hypothetical protein [Bacteroidales bacterium]
MKKLYLLILFSVSLFAFTAYAQDHPKASAMPVEAVKLQSPDGQLLLRFAVVDGHPQYTLDRAGSLWCCPHGWVSPSSGAKALTTTSP